MKEYKYFNPHRASHLEFGEYLQNSLGKIKDIKIINYDSSVQNIFIGDQYYMTIDWSKV